MFGEQILDGFASGCGGIFIGHFCCSGQFGENFLAGFADSFLGSFEDSF